MSTLSRWSSVTSITSNASEFTTKLHKQCANAGMRAEATQIWQAMMSALENKLSFSQNTDNTNGLLLHVLTKSIEQLQQPQRQLNDTTQCERLSACLYIMKFLLYSQRTNPAHVWEMRDELWRAVLYILGELTCYSQEEAQQQATSSRKGGSNTDYAVQMEYALSCLARILAATQNPSSDWRNESEKRKFREFVHRLVEAISHTESMQQNTKTDDAAVNPEIFCVSLCLIFERAVAKRSSSASQPQTGLPPSHPLCSLLLELLSNATNSIKIEGQFLELLRRFCDQRLVTLEFFCSGSRIELSHWLTPSDSASASCAMLQPRIFSLVSAILQCASGTTHLESDAKWQEMKRLIDFLLETRLPSFAARKQHAKSASLSFSSHTNSTHNAELQDAWSAAMLAAIRFCCSVILEQHAANATITNTLAGQLRWRECEQLIRKLIHVCLQWLHTMTSSLCRLGIDRMQQLLDILGKHAMKESVRETLSSGGAAHSLVQCCLTLIGEQFRDDCNDLDDDDDNSCSVSDWSPHLLHLLCVLLQSGRLNMQHHQQNQLLDSANHSFFLRLFNRRALIEQRRSSAASKSQSNHRSQAQQQQEWQQKESHAQQIRAALNRLLPILMRSFGVHTFFSASSAASSHWPLLQLQLRNQICQLHNNQSSVTQLLASETGFWSDFLSRTLTNQRLVAFERLFLPIIVELRNTARTAGELFNHQEVEAAANQVEGQLWRVLPAMAHHSTCLRAVLFAQCGATNQQHQLWPEMMQQLACNNHSGSGSTEEKEMMNHPVRLWMKREIQKCVIKAVRNIWQSGDTTVEEKENGLEQEEDDDMNTETEDQHEKDRAIRVQLQLDEFAGDGAGSNSDAIEQLLRALIRLHCVTHQQSAASSSFASEFEAAEFRSHVSDALIAVLPRTPRPIIAKLFHSGAVDMATLISSRPGLDLIGCLAPHHPELLQISQTGQSAHEQCFIGSLLNRMFDSFDAAQNAKKIFHVIDRICNLLNSHAHSHSQSASAVSTWRLAERILQILANHKAQIIGSASGDGQSRESRLKMRALFSLLTLLDQPSTAAVQEEEEVRQEKREAALTLFMQTFQSEVVVSLGASNHACRLYAMRCLVRITEALGSLNSQLERLYSGLELLANQSATANQGHSQLGTDKAILCAGLAISILISPGRCELAAPPHFNAHSYSIGLNSAKLLLAHSARISLAVAATTNTTNQKSCRATTISSKRTANPIARCAVRLLKILVGQRASFVDEEEQEEEEKRGEEEEEEVVSVCASSSMAVNHTAKHARALIQVLHESGILRDKQKVRNIQMQLKWLITRMITVYGEATTRVLFSKCEFHVRHMVANRAKLMRRARRASSASSSSTKTTNLEADANTKSNANAHTDTRSVFGGGILDDSDDDDDDAADNDDDAKSTATNVEKKKANQREQMQQTQQQEMSVRQREAAWRAQKLSRKERQKEREKRLQQEEEGDEMEHQEQLEDELEGEMLEMDIGADVRKGRRSLFPSNSRRKQQQGEETQKSLRDDSTSKFDPRGFRIGKDGKLVILDPHDHSGGGRESNKKQQCGQQDDDEFDEGDDDAMSISASVLGGMGGSGGASGSVFADRLLAQRQREGSERLGISSKRLIDREARKKRLSHKAAKQTASLPGDEYRSHGRGGEARSRAGGDVKRSGRPDPFAFVDLKQQSDSLKSITKSRVLKGAKAKRAAAASKSSLQRGVKKKSMKRKH